MRGLDHGLFEYFPINLPSSRSAVHTCCFLSGIISGINCSQTELNDNSASRMSSVYFSWIIVMKLANVIFILVCLASSICAQTCDSPDCYMNEGNETPCSYCPVGQGVAVENRELQYCSSSPPRDTRCEPCVAGVNFSDASSRSKCMECRRCHADKENQTKACTADSDGECACKEGLFYHDHDTESCVPCTTCREDQEEKKPCTPTENRECGNKSTTTTLPPSTVHLTTNRTTPLMGSPITADKDMSNGGDNTGNKSLGRIIAIAIVCSVSFIIFIVILVRKCIKKNQEDTDTRQNSGDGCLVTFNCCIGNQTNKFNTDSANSQMNGHATQYQQVPPPAESESNGLSNGRSHATTPTTSTTLEMELQQSPANILGFSPEVFKRLITDLDKRDLAGRDSRMLADRYLEKSQETQSRLDNSERPASEVLRMWIQQEKTAEHLIQALKSMGRDDIANYCEEDLNGS